MIALLPLGRKRRRFDWARAAAAQPVTSYWQR
jgi:hypothetical protein